MNVLSIDLDFLFPNMDDIELIEDFRNAGLEYLNEQANELFEQILINCNQSCKLIDSHDQILKYINEPCVLYNVDQHHDIHYSELHCAMVENNYYFDEEEDEKECCWVYWLHRMKLLKEYTWIGNENSEVNLEVLKYGFKFYLMEGTSTNPYFILNKLKTIKFDLIVFVNSKNYINEKQFKYCLDKIKKAGVIIE